MPGEMPGVSIRMKRRLLLVWASLLATLVFQFTTLSQTPVARPQGTPTPEVARIDQLIRDNRSLLSQGKFDDVTRNAEQALALSQQIGDLGRQSRSTLQIATAAYHTGLVQIAIEKFKQAALLAEQAGDNNLQSLSLNSAASLLHSAGAFEEALSFYTKSLALRRRLKDRRGEATVLAQMSPLYRDTGDLATGDRLLQDALSITRELKANGKEDKQLEDYILNRIAYGEYLRGNNSAALSAYQNAIANETARTSGATKFEARQMLVVINTSLRNWEQVATLSVEALELARSLKITDAEDLPLAYLGWAQFHLGKPREALDSLLRAVASSRQNGNRLQETDSLESLAEVQRALGQNEAAAATYREAVNLVELERVRMIPTETSKGGWVSTNHRIFSGAINSLVSLHKESEAFEIAETYHARAFLDVLAESKIDLRRDLTTAQKQQEEAIFTQITGIQKELWNPKLENERERKLRDDLQHAEQQLESFKLEVRRANPRYTSFKYPQPLNVDRISRELLDADTALIEFVMGEDSSFAWVIHQGRVSTVTLPSQKEIEALVRDYRASLSEKVSVSAPRSIAKINAQGSALYRKLFGAMAAKISTARKLIIVPDGSLWYLPFETLSGPRKTPLKGKPGNEYLIERFAISYAPSATALSIIRETNRTVKDTKGIIAFGDPLYRMTNLEGQETAKVEEMRSRTRDSQVERGFVFTQLPYTREEVNAIASLFDPAERRTFLGAEAQEERVKTENLTPYRYVHFAAHGMIDEEFPARSGIVLSATGNSREDGVLQMSEVMRLRLSADLVTLSACRTGLGKLLSGEGMIGLTRAFHYAGARSVVVSLWNVNDIATSELMKAFYHNLKVGLAKDEALRKAKLELLKGKQRTWQHPYYWAPFVLVGANN